MEAKGSSNEMLPLCSPGCYEEAYESARQIEAARKAFSSREERQEELDERLIVLDEELKVSVAQLRELGYRWTKEMSSLASARAALAKATADREQGAIPKLRLCVAMRRRDLAEVQALERAASSRWQGLFKEIEALQKRAAIAQEEARQAEQALHRLKQQEDRP